MAWDKLMGRGTSAQPQGTTRATAVSTPPSAVLDSDAADTRRDLRRSKRVYIAMAVRVAATRGKDSFQEDTATETVNAHGCMVRLAALVRRDERVTLTNLRSDESTECRVASVGQSAGGKRQVGLEFAKPSGHFWHIAFPPEDWTPPERTAPEPVRPPLTSPKRS